MFVTCSCMVLTRANVCSCNKCAKVVCSGALRFPQRKGLCGIPQRKDLCGIPQRKDLCGIPQRKDLCGIPQRSFLCGKRNALLQKCRTLVRKYRALMQSSTSSAAIAKESYKRDDIPQKRRIILRSLLIVTTPYSPEMACRLQALQGLQVFAMRHKYIGYPH